jgi:hypothetical protein
MNGNDGVFEFRRYMAMKYRPAIHSAFRNPRFKIAYSAFLAASPSTGQAGQTVVPEAGI